jgi:hypothetical protein
MGETPASKVVVPHVFRMSLCGNTNSDDSLQLEPIPRKQLPKKVSVHADAFYNAEHLASDFSQHILPQFT